MANYNLNSFRNYLIFTDQTGSLFDSGGPTGSYSSGQNYYALIAPQNTTGTLTLNIVSGAIDVNDALRIYNGVPNTSSYAGLTVDGTLLAVLSGTLTPQTITASAGRAYIRFGGRTAANTVGTLGGFQLDWTGSGIQTVDSASGVIRNQYAATFPQETYMTFAPGMFTSSATLAATKDILIGMWVKYDYDSTSPLRGLLTVGSTGGTPYQGITIVKTSTTNDLRIIVLDSVGNQHSFTSTNMLLGGGATTTTTAPPQWHHYGWAVRRTNSTSSFISSYRDGTIFASGSTTFATPNAAISSSLTHVVGQYRTAGVISAGQSWTGSFDDIFLGTIDTGSTFPTYNSFFSSIYNSGSWIDPTIQITSSFAGKNGAVLFNWRFEETASMLSTKDWGSYGNIHSASTMVTGGGNAFLTATGSGISPTPYASLAYSASSLSNAVISFNTSSASVYENTASYIFSIQVATASVGQSATASITTGSFGQTAVLGTDYRLISAGTTISSSAQLPFYLSWSAADTTTKYITASIIDNTTYTGNSSSFSLTIQTASSTNITAGSPSFFTLNILDYEEGYASLQSSSYSTGEASGSVTVYVDRLSGSSGPLSVNYFTTNGTALSGTNYTKTTGTLSWVSGNITAQTIVVPITYDNVQTSNLNFTVNLTGLSTGSYSSYPTAITSSTITIADQEPGTFNWSSTTLTAYETGTLATINVNRISGTYGAVTVNISGSSSLGQPLRTTMTGTLSFADGDISKQFTINIQDDLIDESNDVIYYRLYPTSSTSGATSFTGSSGLLAFTLIDNETGSVTFNTGAASVYENTSSYIFNLQRIYGGDQAETASIYFTSNGASYDVIYNNSIQSSPFNVTWADQDKSTKYITASIYDNQTSGSTKLVSFSIASSSVSAIGPSSSFILSVLDYEEGIPSFNSSSYSVGEASGTVQLSVYRYSGSQGPLSVNYTTVNGTALSGTNYTKTTGTLSWADGNTSVQYINVPITYDGVQTSNLNFTVNLSGLSTGSFSNYPNSVTSSTVTITDQEPGTFKISSSSYSVIEGQSFNVTVSRYSGSFGAVTVNLTSSNGTAVSGTDYTQVNQNLSFANTETTKSFSISTIENNTDVTGSLYFNFGINTVSSSYGTAFKGSPYLAQVNIIDNETGSIRFVSASYTGSQNSTIVFSVERYGAADFAATASIVVVGGTAVAGTDYVNCQLE
jgi:Calx-beta domain